MKQSRVKRILGCKNCGSSLNEFSYNKEFCSALCFYMKKQREMIGQ